MPLPVVLALSAPAKINLEIDAAPVSAVLKILTEKTGTALAADDSIGRELVALRFDGLEPKAALEGLASGLNASWKDDRAGLRLTRTSSQASAEREQAVDWRVSRLAWFAKSAREQVAALPPFDPESTLTGMRNAWIRLKDEDDPQRYTAFGQAEGRLPVSRLFRDIRASLDPNVLARLPLGKRIVFSNTPNAKQRSLTSAMVQALRLYDQRRLALQRSNAKLRIPPPSNALRLDDAVVDLKPDLHTAFRLWLRRDVKSIHFGYTLVNVQGVFLADGGDESIYYQAPSRSGVVLHESPIPTSTTGRINAWRRFSDFQPMPDPVRTEMLAPDKNEPLRDVGHVLVECAEAKNEQLCAVLTDRLLLAVPQINELPSNYLGRLDIYAQWVTEQGGWLTVAPADRAEARSRQMDRAIWADWIRAAAEKPVLPLTDMLRLAPLVPLSTENDLPGMLVQCVTGCESRWNMPILRIFAGLAPKGLDQGPMPLDVLPLSSRTAAIEEIENAPAFFAFDVPNVYIAQQELYKVGVLDITDLLVRPGLAAVSVTSRKSDFSIGDGRKLSRLNVRLGFPGNYGLDLNLNLYMPKE